MSSSKETSTGSSGSTDSSMGVSIASSSKGLRSASSSDGIKEVNVWRKSFTCLDSRDLIRAMVSFCLSVGFRGNLLISDRSLDLGDHLERQDRNLKRTHCSF